LTNAEFYKAKAVIMLSSPSPICKQHLGLQINKANRMETFDLYGDNVKTAAGVPGGSFMHVHQAIVNVVGNDILNAHIMLKTGIDAQGMFKLEINRRWGLTTARAWARLLIEGIHILA
jgi:hypothetical protein